MQTNFTAEQLRDPDTAASNAVLRTCVHCGFCTATCPTFLLLGDELDSPRGRIYLIKDMLETGRPATEEVVRHIDRCLSCLSCMTTCPSGVNYMHLVDHARTYIEQTYRRPLTERWLRSILGILLPRPDLFRLALRGARLTRPMARLIPGKSMLAQRLRAMLALTPDHLPAASPAQAPQVHPAQGKRIARVALLTGCAQQVLMPRINEATIRLLTRIGVEVVVAPEAGCCGALNHHIGQHDRAMALARANIAAWSQEADQHGLDAIVINASGCGTTVKDYGFMFRSESEPWRSRAENISKLTLDVTEFLNSCRICTDPRGAEPDCRIPLSVQFAAWPAGDDAAKDFADAGRVPRDRAARGAYLLRFRRHLQPAAAGDRRPSADAQAGKPESRRARSDRRRQYRLHHPVVWRRHSGGPHGGIARLDGRRTAPAWRDPLK